jgi:hypothetical protein
VTGLTKEQILAANDAAPVPVEVPEWGGTVYVRPMSAGERDRWEGELIERTEKRKESIVKATENMRAVFLAKCLCDESGALLFGPEDIEALAGRSYRAVDRAFEAAQSINGLSEADVEELEKNSVGGRRAASSSSSASRSGRRKKSSKRA